jgi:hypothetical protein
MLSLESADRNQLQPFGSQLKRAEFCVRRTIRPTSFRNQMHRKLADIYVFFSEFGLNDTKTTSLVMKPALLPVFFVVSSSRSRGFTASTDGVLTVSY